MKRRLPLASAVIALALSCALPLWAQQATVDQAPTTKPAATMPANMDPTIAAIREEGLNHSQVMQTLNYMCNVIGPRLTGSPALKRANEWTRDQFTSYGLVNAHLEPWGPFGRGWTLKRFALQVVEPYGFPIRAYPKGWTPGFDKPFEAPVIYIEATSIAELDKYKGKLKGAVVLIGTLRTLTPNTEPLFARYGDEELAKAETFPAGTELPAARITPAGRGGNRAGAGGARGAAARGGAATAPATAPGATGGGRGGFGAAGQQVSARALSMANEEGALLVLEPTSSGDGGIMLIQSASVPTGAARGGTPAATQPDEGNVPTTQPNEANLNRGGGGGGRGRGPSIYAVDAPKVPAQCTVAIEDFNRVARMAQQGVSIKMAVDLQVEYQTADTMAYNTVAELPGTDLKEQLVMVGGHLDSWHGGTGATDNGAGCAIAMEAIRILTALHLQPRRTIRVALWSGEEQGLLGSRAYVREHFGYNPPGASLLGGGGGGNRGRGRGAAAANGEDGQPAATVPATAPATSPARAFVKGPEFDNLSIYFNMDNGAGKVRGIYAQSNTEGAPLFKKWFEPFHDLGAGTVTLGNNGQTDHVSFDQIGLPGFQFIQDGLDYFARTHHTTADVYERVPPEDMKQAATILAAFLWDAANMDDRFPRKETGRAAP